MTTKAMAVPIAEQPKKASDFASVAANLANANRKVVQPQPPRHDKFIPHIHTYGRSNPTNIPPVRPLSSNISIASSKAALLAHQGAQQPASQKAPVSAPPKYSVDSRAAAAATKSWNTPQASAAATALNTHRIYGNRGERASPAVTKAWAAQTTPTNRPVVAPLSSREAAMIQRKIEARQQESTDRHGRNPIIRIGAEYLGEHPPVRLEREEKAHAADLHEQAITLAKQAYARQQQTQVSHGSLSVTAQKLANDKLTRLNRSDTDDLNTMKSYYGTPAPPQRSKSQRLLGRSKSTAFSKPGDAEDVAQSYKIRSQMNLLRAQIDHVDANQQEQDRKRLLQAARKKVQNDLLKMDEVVYKDTGKMSKAMMDDWDSKARERQTEVRNQHNQQRAFRGLEPDKVVNIGGGRLVDQAVIDQLAQSRVKPTLVGIDEAVQKKRDIDEQKKEEKKERKREKEKDKEQKAELKREKAEEKRKLKEQKAAEHTDGGEKHSSLVTKLPTLPRFGRHKRTSSTPHTDDEGRVEEQVGVEEEEEQVQEDSKRKSPLRLPAFTKFSRNRRSESSPHVSDDDGDSIEEKDEKHSSRRLSLFGKFGRRRAGSESANSTEEHEEDTEKEETLSPNHKSLKSRFSKLVHRDEYSDAVEHQEESYGPPLRSISSLRDIDDETKARPTISAPMPIEGTMPSEGRLSQENRDDKFFGKHLQSKFQENM
jgi:hypothetical protein